MACHFSFSSHFIQWILDPFYHHVSYFRTKQTLFYIGTALLVWYILSIETIFGFVGGEFMPKRL